QVHLQADGEAIPERAIADLIVVLQTEHELLGRDPFGGSPSWLAVVLRVLAFVDPAASHDPRQLADRAGEILAAPRGIARQQPSSRVMEVVGPDAIEAEAVFRNGPDDLAFVPLVLGDDKDWAIRCGGTGALADLAEDMDRRVIDDRMRRVEAEAVHVEVANPHLSVRQDQLAHDGRLRP